MKYTPHYVISLVLTLLCTSCYSASKHEPGIYTQPYPMDDGKIIKDPGLVYFWPESILEWKVNLVVTKEQLYEKADGKEGNEEDAPVPGSKPEFFLILNLEGDAVELNTTTKPKYDFGFFIPTELMTGPNTDVKELKVTLTDELYLSSIGGGFDDGRAEVVGNILKTGLNLLKLFSSFNKDATNDPAATHYTKRMVLDKHKYTFIRHKPLSKILDSANDSPTAGKRISNELISQTDQDFGKFLSDVAEALKKDSETGVPDDLDAPSLAGVLAKRLAAFELEFEFLKSDETNLTNSAALFKELKTVSDLLHPATKTFKDLSDDDFLDSQDPSSWNKRQYFRGVPYRIPGAAAITVKYGKETLATEHRSFPELGKVGFIDISGDTWVDSSYGATFVTDTAALKEFTVSQTSASKQISSVISDQLTEVSSTYEALKTAKEEAEDTDKEEKQAEVNQELAVYAKEEEISNQRVILERTIQSLEELNKKKDEIGNSNPETIEKVMTAIATAEDLIKTTNDKLRTLHRQLFFLKLGYPLE